MAGWWLAMGCAVALVGMPLAVCSSTVVLSQQALNPDTPGKRHAETEMEVGRYYLKRKLLAGAVSRFKTVVTDYQTTPQVEEALYRIVEANMALGAVREAQAAGAVLGHNFPNSEWYKLAFSLLKSGGVSPSMEGDSWFTKALGVRARPAGP
jgi:hypothetical protein